MRNLIITAAKDNNYFYNEPKWFATSPKGNFMLIESLLGLDLSDIDVMYFGLLKSDLDTYIDENELLKKLHTFFSKEIKIFILSKPTQNQPEAVYKLIQHFQIKGSIFVKDIDTFFEHKIKNENYICYIEIKKDMVLGNVSEKSFIEYNNLYEVINICEKKIISPYISVGGYSFENASWFVKSFEKLNTMRINKNQLYMSHIIYYLIMIDQIFTSRLVSNFEDWDQEKNWEVYKNKFI